MKYDTVLRDNNNDARSEETRARIFGAALDLITEKGIESLTVRKIAAIAGVSPALIIQYFGSKEQLLRSVFFVLNKDMVGGLERVIAATPKDNLLVALQQLSLHLTESSLRYPDLTLRVMQDNVSHVPPVEPLNEVIASPLIGQIKRVIARHHPNLPDTDIVAAAELFVRLQKDVFRHAVLKGTPAEETIKIWAPHTEILVLGIQARAAQIRD